MVLELENLFQKEIRADYVWTAVATLQYRIYNFRTSSAGFSNYVAANTIVTACRPMLVQLLHRHYVASYSEHSLFTDIKFKCNIATSACHQYGCHMFWEEYRLRVEQNRFNPSC
jgi:hypothetical protein